MDVIDVFVTYPYRQRKNLIYSKIRQRNNVFFYINTWLPAYMRVHMTRVSVYAYKYTRMCTRACAYARAIYQKNCLFIYVNLRKFTAVSLLKNIFTIEFSHMRTRVCLHVRTRVCTRAHTRAHTYL